LEADDEEKEDDDDADEADILNEAIARTEEERKLFRQMDIDRRRAEEGAWVAAGNTGKLSVSLLLLSLYSDRTDK
jgi:ATP-dependent helicase STH1/SNF2